MANFDIFEDKLNKGEDIKNKSLDIESEVLFDTKFLEEETINVESETLVEIKEEPIYLVEESVDFIEPEKPANVNEEVLFDDQNDFDIEYVEPAKEDILTEELISELASTEVEDNILEEDLKDEVKTPIPLEKAVLEETLEHIQTPKKKVVKIPFVERIFQLDPIVVERYTEIKEFMLGFKEVNSRISNTADTFNIGRVQLIKLSATGKSLKLYLNLDYDKVETRLKCKDASSKKAYKNVPVFLRVRSPRSMRNAKYLLNQLVEKHGLVPRKKVKKVDCVQLLKDKIK